YGRRASVSVSAEVHGVPGGFALVARPSVSAVGVFRIRFHKVRGSVVQYTEMYIGGDGKLAEGFTRENVNVFGEELSPDQWCTTL
ncbi:MAG TPA: hypothetical protein VGC05_08880, partial [Mycobacterium sp.]